MSNLFENIGIDVGVVVLVLLILTLILIFATLRLTLSVYRLKIRYKDVKKRDYRKSSSDSELEKNMKDKFKDIDRLNNMTDIHMDDIKSLKSRYDSTLSKYGIVKYDAFDDVGGKLSFVLAMLDMNNTGFVLNSIRSRENCFLYIKEIVKGESYIMLSKEEVEALRRAVVFGTEHTEDTLM